MKILFCGDVVGKAGRKLLLEKLPELKTEFNLDMVIVNAENAAHGFGLTPKLYQEIVNGGADVLTMGNHTFDKKEINSILETADNIVRPLNYPENTIGKGFCVHTTLSGVRVAVVQLLGSVYMRAVENPFECVRDWLKSHLKGQDYDVLVVDMHAEATAEKVAMGHYLDGQAALVVGTHTHIPTADAHILPGGTAYITDLGMCGDYDSVIGMLKENAISRFFPCKRKERLAPAEQEATVCAVCVDIDEKTGLAKDIFPIRVGATLENTHNL